jgi:hypothetical protein
MSRFINDLIPIILENDDHWWTMDLLRLATVSPAWLGAVRRRLYECPTLFTFTSFRLFARSLKGNNHLIALIRGIDLRPSARCYATDVEEEMASLRYILSLGVYGKVVLGGELAVKAERFLHSLAHPESVTELRIDGNTENGECGYFHCQRPPSLEWDNVIAFKFSNLRRLKLSNLELDIVYSPVPYEFGLEDLVIDNVQIIGGYFCHIHQSCLRHLHVIAINSSDIDEHLRLMLDLCGSTIETLHFEIRRNPRCRVHIFDNDSRPCPSLHQLHLSDVEIDVEMLSAIAQICPNLEVLIITGRSVSVSADEWTTFIGSGTLPKLRYLVTPYGTQYPPFVRWLPYESQ